MKDWTEEQKAEVARLWAAGLSCTQIGKRFRVSRCSIAGLARRMNLPTRTGSPRGEGRPPAHRMVGPRDYARHQDPRRADARLRKFSWQEGAN